jgi:hypothetical protein
VNSSLFFGQSPGLERLKASAEATLKKAEVKVQGVGYQTIRKSGKTIGKSWENPLSMEV